MSDDITDNDRIIENELIFVLNKQSINPIYKMKSKSLSDTSAHTVLIVDDDKFNRELLSRRLGNEGYIITTAENGEEAVKLLHVERFNLLLLDLNMPTMNGFDVLEWLQAHGKHGMRVIMLTASGERDTVNTCLTLGADDYILKSANLTEMIPRVRRACEVSTMEVKQGSQGMNESWDNAHILLVDDDKLNLELMRRHFRIDDIHTYVASDGHAALKIIEESRVDLVLLDYHMKGLNGMEVLRHIREKWHYDDIGVIMVTAEDAPDLIKQLYKTGADDYIAKPFHAAELVNRAHNVLINKRLKQKERRLLELEKLGEDIRPD